MVIRNTIMKTACLVMIWAGGVSAQQTTQKGTSSVFTAGSDLEVPAARQQENMQKMPSLMNQIQNDSLPGPRLEARAGGFVSGDHSFMVEMESDTPILRSGNWMLYYSNYEMTPFLDEGGRIQVELLNTVDRINFEYYLNDEFAITPHVGYQQTWQVDRNGKGEASMAGVTIGTPYSSRYVRDLTWSFTMGAMPTGNNIEGNWYMQGDVRYMLLDLDYIDGMENLARRPRLNWEAGFDTVNQDLSRAGIMAETGPTLEFTTINGNKLDLFAHYLGNHGNQFKFADDDGMFIGFSVEALREVPLGTSPTDWRDGDILPKVYGNYTIGGNMAGDFTTRFRIDTEIYQFRLGVPLSFYAWFEPRRVWGHGTNMDNSLYNVGVGLKSPVVLPESWRIASNGWPIQVGAEFFHRSDHTLNPPAELVAQNNKGPGRPYRYDWEGSINTFPFLWTSTAGYDCPTVYAEMFEDRTEFINYFDWKAGVGYTLASTGNRPRVTGLAGLQWNIATLYGFVPYVRGEYSVGAQPYVYSGEFGVMRPLYKVFVRLENPDTDFSISRGTDDLLFGGISFFM